MFNFIMSNKLSKEGKMKWHKEHIFCPYCKLETNHIILQSVDVEGMETLWLVDNIPISIDWFDYYQIIQCQWCNSISFRHVNYFSEFDPWDKSNIGVTKRVYLINSDNKIPIDLNNDVVIDPNNHIIINSDNQTIKIWNRYFENFRNLFDVLLIKGKKTQSQKKWGISLIYAFARYLQEDKDIKNMMISNLIYYYNEFKIKWDKRVFDKKGIKKTAFTKTDCDSANTILGRCKLKIRLDLDKKNKKIFIKK